MGGKKKASGKPQSELHKALIAHLVKLRNDSGMSLQQFAADAGITQQAFNKWQHGSSPTIESLEGCARAVGGDLYVRIRTAEEQTAEGEANVDWTMESIEIAHYVDKIPDPAARAEIRDLVKRAAEHHHRTASANPHEPAEATTGSRHGRRR